MEGKQILDKQRQPQVAAATRQAVMRQGAVFIEERPLPELGDHQILVRNEYSAISTGTETMLLRQGGTVTEFGYNSVGIIEAKGMKVEHLHVGQRVAVYGVPAHAEYRIASKFLAVPVPDHVDPEEAVFVGLGAIAIHALRQSELRFGESAVVVGLGILGQIIAQIAEAAAIRVIGVDLLPQRGEALKSVAPGAAISRNPSDILQEWGHSGADSVFVCAGSQDDQLLDQAIDWVRFRGNIVIVGVPNTVFDRNALFLKEAQILISRAAGPGRYNAVYEQQGVDYEPGYVRWTEGRNVEEFIRLLAAGKVSMKPLIRHRFHFNDVPEAFRLCMDQPQDTLGIIIRY